MNSAIRLAFIVTTFSIVASSVSGKSEKGLASAQDISIRLYDRAHASAGVLHSATDEAGWLFRTARIRISWIYPSTEPAEDQGADMTSAAFQQSDMRPYIVVRLMRGTRATILPGALGYALPFAHSGAHVLIFYDRVEALAHSANKATSLILGYAMAHELGHVLLGSSDHTRGGLMQGRWTSESWHLASSGLLAFTHAEAERMHARAQRLDDRKLSPSEQPISISSALGRSPE